MPAPSTVNPAQCPLCGQSNQCAMQLEKTTGEKQPPCWCTTATFSEALLARIPENARYTACVCAACASRAPQER